MLARERTGPTKRAHSKHHPRRRRGNLLSLEGLCNWQLEDRCLLSTAPTTPLANPVIPLVRGFSNGGPLLNPSSVLSNSATPLTTVQGLSGSGSVTGDSPLTGRGVSSNAQGSNSAGLSLASGHTVIIDVSSTPVLELTGDLNNQGTIYFVSTNPLVRNVSISARNISEGAGALITTMLPSGGLAGYGNAISDLSLTLIAQQNIINNGVITSGNELTALAGGTVTNASTVGDRAGSGSLQAVGELNVLAATVINHGVMSSTAGDVNVADPGMYASAGLRFANGILPAFFPQNININNTSGVIQAFAGMINIGGPELGTGAILDLTGGDFIAQAISIQAGTGAIQADVDNVTGPVNLSGGSAQFASDTSVLDLGRLDVVGDPTIYNFGDIQLDGSIKVGESLAILARGKVTASKAIDIETGGHSVYVMAGGDLKLSDKRNGNARASSTEILQPGQFIDVSGGTGAGGTISLNGSTIDTRPTSSDQPGGSVTLIAYGGPNSGGISNVNILSGGSGIGANGGVTLVAGGTIGAKDLAISGISIDASGGTGVPLAAIKISAAKPTGAVRFDSSGVATGAVFALGLTGHDIALGGTGIRTDGGAITIKTGGAFSSQATISSSGVGDGRNAGDITINASTIRVDGALRAVGSNGASRVGPAVPGQAGIDGQDGGNGGMITLKDTKGIDINVNIQADGGNGGNGGNGGEGIGLVEIGSAGGKGGGGGRAGTISLTTNAGVIDQAVGVVISALGGSGGNGGGGGKGGTAPNVRAGDGGRGGNGGMASAGGSLRVDAGAGSIKFSGTLSFDGGSGGGGGSGGNGGNGDSAAGGNGGNTGASQSGAMGGMISLKTKRGAISLASVTANGGSGGQTAASGAGGNGIMGGAGGSILDSGDGGQGGELQVLSRSGAIAVTKSIQFKGGAGGNQTQIAGGGGDGSNASGGAGGSIGNGGGGGKGGRLAAQTKGAVTVSGGVNAGGGAGGNLLFATGGKGGRGAGAVDAIGGAGGGLLNGGAGGDGGSVTIEAKDNIDVNAPVDISGGAGGGMIGTGGKGGDGPKGAIGGSVGASGAGGGGGTLKVKTSKIPPNRLGTITVTFRDVVNATGGAAGLYLGRGGNGGNGSSGNGGNGGEAGSGGSGGGGGGSMDVSGLNLHITSTGLLNANGGSSGVHLPGGFIIPGYAGISGDGGNGGGIGGGGSGGRVGDAGSAGNGGMIRLEIPGDITLDEDIRGSDRISARGGLVSDDKAVSGKGGKSGPGSVDVDADGGASGNIGHNGSAGWGGVILIKGGAGDITGSGVLAVAGGKVYDMAASSGTGGNAGLYGAGGSSGTIGDNGNAGKGGQIIVSSTSGTIGLRNLIAPGGDVDGTFKPQTGNGGTGGSIDGNGGSSGDIGNNGKGGDGGLIKETSNRGTIGVIGKVEGKFASLIAAGGEVAPIVDLKGTPSGILDVHIYAPSQAKTGDGGGAVTGNGGRSGKIGNNGSGGDGGEIVLTTVSGNVNMPKGVILTAGGDGGTAFNITGNGGSTQKGIGGKSGDIERNSDGGKAGPITIKSTFGNIALAAPLILRGASASNSGDRTGDGGTSMDGTGGKSGDIGSTNNFGVFSAGGTAGGGGKLTLIAGGSITTSEASIATGGDAGALSPPPPPGFMPGEPAVYRPVTGNGGDGSSQGGDSGKIGAAGAAGNGGEVVFKTKAPPAQTGRKSDPPNIEPDRINVNGGRAGSEVIPTFEVEIAGIVISLTITIPAGDGVQRGKTGNGGAGDAGGSAGGVGGGVKGGDAGSIEVSSDGAIIRSVFFLADGGFGGNQAGTAGNGGNAAGIFNGGNGGSVDGAGNGGNGGKIELTAQKGITLKEVEGYGGAGGNDLSTAAAGNGGNGLLPAGNGGNLGGSGSGGKGGTLVVKTPPVVTPETKGQLIDVEGNAGMNFYGGNGGSMAGSAGNGGNGTGDEANPDSVGGNGGNCLPSGAGGPGGSIFLSAPGAGGRVELLMGASVNGGDSQSYTAKSGNGGTGTGSKPGGKGGDSGNQGDGGGPGGNPTIMSIKIETGTFTLAAHQNLEANGGGAQTYINTPGNGGNGGVAGGDGGSGGKTGTGGGGGTIEITTDRTQTINGVLSANGGERFGMSVSSGSGGDALGEGTATGGMGGMIPIAGSAGGGGGISLTSKLSDVSGDGSLSADGGVVEYHPVGVKPTPVMIGGHGGRGGTNGLGGAGGSTGDGAGGGDGGKISVQAKNGISLGGYSANGGSVFGDFDAVGGKGGDDANGGERGGAGAGGGAGNNGKGGDGGAITLGSLGAVTINTASAIGGSVGDMSAIGGAGGNQVGGVGAGGAGGSVANNGNGGTGGRIKISKQSLLGAKKVGPITTNGRLDVSGGSVGVYSAISGDGGSAGPDGGAGGAGGRLGSNGKGGDGNTIEVLGYDFAVKVNGALVADGGSVAGPYSGKAGNGGDGRGDALDDVAGEGASLGINGSAGGGGSITVSSNIGAISTQLISAVGGNTSAQQGKAGDGGKGGVRGGVGGSIGGGTAGGRGGTVDIESQFGPITLNDDLNANGSAGGAVNAKAGNGGSGTIKGLDGGAVEPAGDGGRGGTITVKTKKGTLTINTKTSGDPVVISTNGGNGGTQLGKGGKGGDSNFTDGTGGDGGTVKKAGNGGDGGDITIKATSKPTIINTTATGGAAGNLDKNSGGARGEAANPGKPGAVIDTAKKGDDGHIDK